MNLRPGGRKRGYDSFKYCIENSLLGVGWRIEPDREYADHDAYVAAARPYVEQHYAKQIGPSEVRNWRHASMSLKNMQRGDLVWTKDSKHRFYLGRVADETPKYRPGHPFDEYDLKYTRTCDWIPLPTNDLVPAVVFRFARGTIHEIKEPPGVTLSKEIYYELSGSKSYKSSLKGVNLFAIMSPFDFEDVVGLYLQAEKGLFIFPSTCKQDTPKYEFEMKHKVTKQRAIVQVKSGNDRVDMDEYREESKSGVLVYFFQENGSPSGKMRENYTIISRSELESFIRSNTGIMPSRIAHWIPRVASW
jgi:hypothetical protein